jgi:hypothetical protein
MSMSGAGVGTALTQVVMTTLASVLSAHKFCKQKMRGVYMVIVTKEGNEAARALRSGSSRVSNTAFIEIAVAAIIASGIFMLVLLRRIMIVCFFYLFGYWYYKTAG